MNKLHHFSKPIGYVVIAGMLTLSMYLPVANAAMVGTEAAINTMQDQQARNRIQDTLNREEVQSKLFSLGVDPQQVQARVDALTESEVQMLSKHLNEMPAGAGMVNFLLLILILVLIL